METIQANIEWGAVGINRIYIGNNFWVPKDLLTGIRGLKISPIGEPVYWGICNLFGWTFYHGEQGVDHSSHSGWTTFISDISFVEKYPLTWCRQEQFNEDPLLWIYFGAPDGYRKYVLSGYSLDSIAFVGGNPCNQVVGIIGQGNVDISSEIFYKQKIFENPLYDVREHDRIFFATELSGEIRIHVLATLKDHSQVRRIYKLSPTGGNQKLEIESDEPIEEFYTNNPAYRQ